MSARGLLLALGLAACVDPKDDVAGDNQPPVAVIVSPDDGATVSDPAAVRLEGRADDPEDGPLGDAALAWSSDRDGPLGGGGLLTTALSIGAHAITLVATDEDGATDSVTIQLVVSGENQPPTPVITSPEDGAVVREGSPLVLEGAADDLEDGALSGASLVWASSRDGFLGTGSTVGVPTPSLGEHVVTLTAIDALGAEASTSIGVTVAAVGQNLPPRVTVTTPLDGATVTAGDDVTLAGTASDPEDGAITSGLVWREATLGTLATGNGTTTRSFDPGAWTLTLTASDRQGLQGSATVTIAANPAGGNRPPEVTLLAPSSGDTVAAGEPLALRAVATDTEDGTLSGAAIGWRSSLDGALGTGGSLDATLAGVGRHTLTVTATDSGGAVDVASVDVFVLAPNQPPVVAVTQPAAGSRVVAGTSVRFAGTANDPEDGALTGSALTWASSLQGTLGTGSPLDTASLVAGVHTVTLTAIDGGGRAGTAQRSITVDPAAVNLPPIAVLTGAPTASVDLPWTADASGSSDPDGRITSYAVDWGDGSAVTTGTSAIASHVYAAAGTYVVTLTVTDDDGAADDATTQVVAAIPPRVPEIAAALPTAAGGWCALALDAQERPWVAFAEVVHGQVWLARRSSTRPSGTWTVELVEGPGFQIGGVHTGTGDLAVDAAGVAHVAYALGGDVRYAQRSAAGAWTVESVGDGVEGAHVALQLDAASGGRPVIATERVVSDIRRLLVTRRTGPGAWTAVTSGATSDERFTGAFVLRPDGTGIVLASDPYTSSIGARAWTGTSLGAASPITTWSTWAQPRWDAVLGGGKVHAVLADGVWTEGATWTPSAVVNEGDDDRAVAWDAAAGAPVVGFRSTGGELELQRADGVDAWSWLYQGPMDATSLDVAVEADGDARACFFRSGTLVVY